jgi:A/G-specific adenine glycosylase
MSLCVSVLICVNQWLTVTPRNFSAIRTALFRWHRRHAQLAPWRESGDAYHALVAAVMAQQTQMSRVLPKYEEFIAVFPSIEALAAATAGDVLRAWAPLGYNMRALRLHRAARFIAGHGAFPRSAAELERIEGIGPFTAAIVSSFAFGEAVAAIDTNVHRIVERISANGDANGVASALLSRRAPGRWNQAMMDLGALVCTSRAPKCGACPIAQWCASYRRQAFSLAAKVADSRASYRVEPPFKHSRRYYRGRIVQALRELPAGHSMDRAALRERIGENNIDGRTFNGLIASLERDGLVHVTRADRVRLP